MGLRWSPLAPPRSMRWPGSTGTSLTHGGLGARWQWLGDDGRRRRGVHGLNWSQGGSFPSIRVTGEPRDSLAVVNMHGGVRTTVKARGGALASLRLWRSRAKPRLSFQPSTQQGVWALGKARCPSSLSELAGVGRNGFDMAATGALEHTNDVNVTSAPKGFEASAVGALCSLQGGATYHGVVMGPPLLL